MKNLTTNLRSWKTSAVGILSGVGILIAQLTVYLDSDPATVVSIEAIGTALALLGVGIFAKDGDKKSSDVGL